jgi:hypothetical protein
MVACIIPRVVFQTRFSVLYLTSLSALILQTVRLLSLHKPIETHLLCNSRPQAAGGDSASFVRLDGGYLLVNELCALLALQKPGLEDC